MNLNTESQVSGDPTQWTKLQTEICMRIAHAKLDAFVAEAERLAELVRYGLLSSAIAADYLQEAAIYNQLVYEYGQDHIQAIMSAAGNEAAA